MRRQILVLLGAAAFTFGTAANAAVTVDDTSFEATDGPDTTGTTTTIGYTDTDLDNPSFSEFLTFTNDLADNDQVVQQLIDNLNTAAGTLAADGDKSEDDSHIISASERRSFTCRRQQIEMRQHGKPGRRDGRDGKRVKGWVQG